MMYFYALLAVIFLLLVYELLYKRKMNAYLRQMPSHRGYTLIKYALMCMGSSADFFRDLEKLLQKSNGKYSTRIGTKMIFILSDPKDLKAITSNPKLNNKSTEYRYLKPWLGEGLLTGSGDKWGMHRKFIMPAFHFNILKQFVPVIEENVDKLLQKLSCFTDEEAFNIFPHVALYTLDVISEATMGVSVNAQTNSDSEYLKAVHGMCNLAVTRMWNIFLRLDIFFNLSPSKFKQNLYLKSLFDFTEDVIRRRKMEVARNIESHSEDTETGVKKRLAFLDLMLMSDINGKKLSDRSIRDEVNTFMFAGHDTTAWTISYMLYCLAEYSDVQEKVFAEQLSIFGADTERRVEYNDLQEMKYLDLVIKETLRMYPSASILARDVEDDTEINGIKVPKGATVALSVYHMHHRSDLYDDPCTFTPERFSPDSQENQSRNPYSYAPFSVGPRNCIGQKFGIMEMKISISKLVRKFQFHSGGKKLNLAFDIILTSTNGVNIKLTKRQW